MAEAAYAPLTYQYRHFFFTLDPDAHPEWRTTGEAWFLHGREIVPPAELRVDGDALPSLPEGMVRQMRPGWDAHAIAVTIGEQMAASLDRPAGSVAISRTATGMVVFQGVGMPGRRVDLDRAARLTVAALEQGIDDILLPVDEIQPAMQVLDDDLRAGGIREVVTLGESDFSASPWARRHNIGVGLRRFNGVLIPQGATFSFNEALGPVGPATGYKKELVIKGEKTLPDYGGGLCQVSTTAYRGVWEYGFPIVQRKNHSYAVRYYAPQGTDATIYPPGVDMKFVNDSPGDILIQTFVDTGSSLAYFIYYGTRDSRETDLIGPYTWGHTEPPPDRVEYTTEILPGETRKAGGRVPGMKALWYRVVRTASGTGETIEPVFSAYEARPLYTQIGVAELPPEEPRAPDWIGGVE